MSETTKAALDAAIEAHVSDEGEGHLLTGYVLIAVGINAGNLDRQSSNYFTEYADHQPYHASLGLAHQLVDEVRDYAGYDLEEED